MFLYGLGAEKGGISNLPIVLVLGVGAAFATFWLLQQGSRILSWRVFFRISEILLLLLAGALLVSGVEKLIALDVLPALVDPVWDTTRLLDDSGRVGGLIASFTGYRARPALLPLLALALYWSSCGCSSSAREHGRQRRRRVAPVSTRCREPNATDRRRSIARQPTPSRGGRERRRGKMNAKPAVMAGNSFGRP